MINSKPLFILNSSNKCNSKNIDKADCFTSHRRLLFKNTYTLHISQFLEHKKQIVIYRNEKELLELADYYLGNDDAREVIAAEGLRKVLN